MIKTTIACLCVVSAGFMVGCGFSQAPEPAGASDMNDSQVPPQGASALEAWLAGGAYKSWHCEASAHAPRGPSPHTPGPGGGNRICDNDALSGYTGTGPFPVGSAAVKEIFDTIPPTDPNHPLGYAVYVKTGDGDCTSYYYYERAGSTVYADGPGSAGAANQICVSCHEAAGMDAMHLAPPAGDAHDCVYTQVK